MQPNSTTSVCRTHTAHTAHTVGAVGKACGMREARGARGMKSPASAPRDPGTLGYSTCRANKLNLSPDVMLYDEGMRGLFRYRDSSGTERREARRSSLVSSPARIMYTFSRVMITNNCTQTTSLVL